MRLVSSAVAATLLCVSSVLAQQPAGTPTPAPASGAASASGSPSCPAGSSGSASATPSCPVQVTVNNNPAPTPSPTPTPRLPKNSIHLELVPIGDPNNCPCPDAKQTAAIAKILDPIVPGAHVKPAGAGYLTIVWEESVADQAIQKLKDLAEGLRKSGLPPSDAPDPKSPTIVSLTNHKAREIAHKLDNSVAGITVAAIPNDSDDRLVVSWDKDALAAAVPDLLNIIHALDVADTAGTASSPTIRLYNNRNAAEIAKILTGFQKITVAPQGNDLLVLSGASTGNEGAIDELKRYVAVLDLPRPQLALNLWSAQLSSQKLEDANRQAARVRETVNTYNSLLSDSYDRGWRVITYLTNKRTEYDWRNRSFSDYVGQRFISCSPFYRVPDKDAGGNPAEFPGQLCFAEDAKPEAAAPEGALTRHFLHACKKGQYCLGFTFAFNPIKASLTNLLFALAAAEDPGPLAKRIVTCMESADRGCGEQQAASLINEKRAAKDQAAKTCKFDLEPEENCTKVTQPPVQPPAPDTLERYRTENQELKEALDSCKRACSTTGESRGGGRCECAQVEAAVFADRAPQADCELMDQAGYEKDDQENLRDCPACNEEGANLERVSGKLHFGCFKEELQNVFASSRRTGLMRAAIADFLFHYKMSIQYPHEFVAYDLSHSADTLDSHFHPLLAAYNRDVAGLLRFLQEKLNHPKSGDFASEGIVSVSVISGNPAAVDAKTANSFESTTPFTIAEFLNQLKSAESSTPALLKNNLTAEEANAIVAAFNVQKPTNISIGRDLSLTATAFSLATGSAADLKVTMASKDDGQPQQTFPSSGTKNDINPSRVASHTVDTIVRVESTKLFELSSFSAELRYRGNSYPVPIIGELPWIGPAFRWPGTVHKVYHRSFAIISAIVVPNAADLAEGLPFTGDRMLAIPSAVADPCKEAPPKCPAGACVEIQKKCPGPPANRQSEAGGATVKFSGEFHAKTFALDSLRELPPQVREFHKEKLRCFITNETLATCKDLNFGNFPEDGRPGDKNAEEP